MSEDKIDSLLTVPKEEEKPTNIEELQAKHEANQKEKQKLKEVLSLLEQDEADLVELRRQVLELIRQRVAKL